MLVKFEAQIQARIFIFQARPCLQARFLGSAPDSVLALSLCGSPATCSVMTWSVAGYCTAAVN